MNVISEMMETLYSNPVLRAVSKPFMDLDRITAAASPTPNHWSDKVPSREITKEEIASVGVRPADYDETAKKYDPAKLQYGYNTVDSEEIYFIPNPALGLWINREKFEG